MKIIGYTLMAIGVLNFVSFAIISTYLGGDAPHGKIEDGKYYVGGHGHFSEVSRTTFQYSTIHSEWFVVTLPLVAIGWIILEREKKKRHA